MLPHFPKGTRLYIPSARWSNNVIKCTACKGTTKILTKALGDKDEDGYIHECEYCKWSLRDGLPQGHIADTANFVPHVEEIVVEGVECIERPGKSEVKYLWNVTSCSWNSADSGRVLAHRDQAEAEAKRMAEAAQTHHDSAYKKTDLPNNSHSIGYAKSRVKELLNQLAPWEKMVGSQKKKK